MKQRHAKHYARGWLYARALLVAGLVGLGFWAGANIWISATDPDAWTATPTSCTTDADCAAKYPDFEGGADPEGSLDE